MNEVILSEVFLKIVNMSISASWLVLAVVLLRLVLKRAPKWVSVLLWGFVAIRLICPFSIESMLSLIPSAETVSPEIMMDWTPEISTGIGSVDTVINPIITQTFAPNPATSANPLQILIPVAGIFWLAGIVALLLYTAVSYFLLRRKVATAVLLRNNIYQSENVASPFVLGIIKPKIYLPFEMDSRNIAYVIAHEEAHICRKDHWWKPVGFLLLALHWFNPLMWLGYILLCRDIELACDEKVIGSMDSEAKADYSQALVACSVSHRSIAACPLAFGEVGVKERVKSVLSYRKPAFWIVMAGMAVCAAVAVCFLTDPKAPSSSVLPNVYSQTYVVDEVTYEDGIYSFTVVAGENSPVYAISENMVLSSQGEIGAAGQWTELGQLEEMKLTKEDFDDLFITPLSWADGANGKDIRSNTKNAWRLLYGQEVLYYILQQENGDLYLAYGYQTSDQNADPGSFRQRIRWLFKLEIDTSGTGGMVARSGDNTVPMLSFPKGTEIGDYAQKLHYLTIDPGEEFVPFTVWKDGQELRGTYNAFDAETFLPVEYLIPSGLDPQTYLFQNADPTRAYIVLATFSTEPDSEIYAFGAKFDSSVTSVGGADDTAVEYRFTATVLEVNEAYLLVEPAEGSRERNSADKIEVPLKKINAWPVPQVGDLVTVFYNGELQETYPARITQVYRVEINAAVETVEGNFRTYYKNADGTWQYDGRTYQYRLEITGRMHNAAADSTFVFLSNIPTIPFERAWRAAGYSSNTEDYYEPEEAVLVEISTGNLITSAYDGSGQRKTKPETKLDAAISDAIGSQTERDKPDGFFYTQSHIVLAKDAASGTPAEGQTEHIQEETVFVYYLTMQFRIQDTQPQEQNRIFGQAIISFEVDEEGNYALKKFLRPQYSADYDEAMKRFVPASEEAAKNAQVYDQQLLDGCWERATDYFNNLKAQASAQPGGV